MEPRLPANPSRVRHTREWPVRLANGAFHVTLSAMTTVATCSNPAEAMLLRSMLEANDIPAYVPEELTAQAAPHFSGSGIRVEVEDQHAEAARRILAEAEQSAAEEAGESGEAADDREDQSR